jgi:hypothetical protein
MPDIQKIIKAIDNELKRTGEKYITPPEANKILEKMHILNDRDAYSGLPLRNLLRQGRIPHAYQIGGKGSQWRIPHSIYKNSKPSNYSEQKAIKVKTKPVDNINKVDFTKVKIQIEQAREKYKPDEIKYILVAEAPPESLDRFFYFLNVRSSDWLFLGVMQALYSQQKDEYLIRKRDSALKEKLLLRFKEDGFYLVDLLDYPLSYYTGNLSETTAELIKKVKHLANERTQIILIKANVFDTAFTVLKESGFNVIDKKIDFPASGGQKKFHEKFIAALKEAKYLE